MLSPPLQENVTTRVSSSETHGLEALQKRNAKLTNQMRALYHLRLEVMSICGFPTMREYMHTFN